MLAIISRVHHAKLRSVAGHFASIGKGLVVLVGIAPTDSEREVNLLIKKTTTMRLFSEDAEKMDYSLLQVGGELLLISQFTLFGDSKKGTRPSFSKAASHEYAREVYQHLTEGFRKKLGSKLQTGDFGKHMDIDVAMNGPVTINLQV